MSEQESHPYIHNACVCVCERERERVHNIFVSSFNTKFCLNSSSAMELFLKCVLQVGW